MASSEAKKVVQPGNVGIDVLNDKSQEKGKSPGMYRRYKMGGEPTNYFFIQTYKQYGFSAVLTLLFVEFFATMITVFVPTLLSMLSLLPLQSQATGQYIPMAPLNLALIQSFSDAAFVKVWYKMVPGATGNYWFAFESFLLEIATEFRTSKSPNKGSNIKAEAYDKPNQSDQRCGMCNKFTFGCLSCLRFTGWCCWRMRCWSSTGMAVLAYFFKMICVYGAQLAGGMTGVYLAIYAVPSASAYSPTTPYPSIAPITNLDNGLDSSVVAGVLSGLFFFIFVFVFNRVHRSMPLGVIAFGESGDEHNDISLLACIQFIASLSLYTTTGCSLNIYLIWANSIQQNTSFQNVYTIFLGQFIGGVIAFSYCFVSYHVPAISMQTSFQPYDSSFGSAADEDSESTGLLAENKSVATTVQKPQPTATTPGSSKASNYFATPTKQNSTRSLTVNSKIGW
jgi:hypothetical protein